MGVYTNITQIVAPSSAAPGEKVPVTVKVKNIDDYWDHVIKLIVVFYDVYGEMDSFISEVVIIRSLETHSFSGSFTMPNRDTVIDAFTYYPIGKEWIFDDRKSKDISLAEVPEPYAGTISKKQLEYDESRASIPAYNVPQGERGLVHIWGRNDMSTNQKMGISWRVKDPDGVVVEEYSYWELFWTGPGKTQEFIGDRFNLNKTGSYRLEVSLMMNPNNPVVVGTYSGILCTVAAPVFAGIISGMELEYDEARANIPASGIPQNQRGLVHIWGRNDMSTNQKMGISWRVEDPDGVVVEEYSYWELFWTGPVKTQEFIGDRFDLSKEGPYTLKVDLLMNPDDPVIVDSYSGILCTVVAPVLAGTITRVVLEYDQAEGDIPVSDIPLGQRGLVHVYGRNDMDEAQRMGISWVVKDLDGVVVEEYSGWELWPYTGAGKEHEFIGDRFDLNKEGAYTISIDLFMGESGVAVAAYGTELFAGVR